MSSLRPACGRRGRIGSGADAHPRAAPRQGKRWRRFHNPACRSSDHVCEQPCRVVSCNTVSGEDCRRVERDTTPRRRRGERLVGAVGSAGVARGPVDAGVGRRRHVAFREADAAERVAVAVTGDLAREESRQTANRDRLDVGRLGRRPSRGTRCTPRGEFACDSWPAPWLEPASYRVKCRWQWKAA